MFSFFPPCTLHYHFALVSSNDQSTNFCCLAKRVAVIFHIEFVSGSKSFRYILHLQRIVSDLNVGRFGSEIN